MSDAYNERELVELPLLKQLAGLDWQRLSGDTGVPQNTERDSFREVLLKARLRACLRRINRTEAGEEWLDDARLNAAIGALELPASTHLMEANRSVTELLLNGTVVEGDPEVHGGKGQTVRYIDFEKPENNDFLVVDQYRVEAVGRAPIIPDVVLFVNGIPLVVIECKSPDITDPVETGIDQILRYSGQRKGVENEGVEKLF
ncbi:MAG: type I restriction endonuclease, partial [Actinomycetota bacterium]|nr:type I restriction endonuclease [Actinomycetota bacterium]